MVFLHIDTKNYENKNKNGKTDIDELNKIIQNNGSVFILYYMEGCGPCNQTRPEWKKIKNVLKKMEDKSNIAIVDIDQVLSSKIKDMSDPNSFPTIRFISEKGTVIENYEDSNIKTKDRSIDSFVDWINIKTKHMKGGMSKRKIYKRHITKRKINGGKWSLKYKRSINCNRPKGFSQKQYCKYSRNK
jgi:vacuolar-type H+-ATPase subunit F/Vma7